ncbi:MAG: sensor histidine kinase [bacterium]|nr:sensor histidine kinase [bacterium]
MINTQKMGIYRLVFHIIVLACVLVPQILFIERVGLDTFQFSTILLLCSIIIFHFGHIYFLIPRLLKKHHNKAYILSVIAILLAFFLTVFNTFDLSGDTIMLMRNNEIIRTFKPQPIPPVIPMVLLILVGLVFELILDREAQRRKVLESEQDKLQVELKLLRSQINPHFFFNTLHNIYSLVVCKSEQAEDAILLLSDLMRYVLYENINGKIHLSKEITFIENYLALQRLRADESNQPVVSFQKKSAGHKFHIEPMLLMPFVENAFKHSKKTSESSVLIKLKVVNNVLIFNIINSISTNNYSSNKTFSGIGLANMKRRLSILYPNKHDLIIHNNGETFSVELSLILI